jgi:UDP-N-acetylmuramate dehydrogenase
MNRLRGALEEAYEELSALPHTTVVRGARLAEYTRFGIGGPADLFVAVSDPASFVEAHRISRASGIETIVIGGGTNLIVADEGFGGLVLKLANSELRTDGETVRVDSGVPLQTLVDYTIDAGLRGLETMTGIPGSSGGAVYGNAGAYGHSIAERISRVHFFDGETVREIDNADCQFHYRESIFKCRKDWIVFRSELTMDRGEASELREAADKIRGIRDKKYPPTMKCAGSIFKNFLLRELPAHVVSEIPAKVIIEGKVPSAWFLEQVEAKGMRAGDIHVADYHANLIYNAGQGTARDVVSIIDELKQRVERRWGIPLQEEVQYVGFGDTRNN